MSHWGYGKDDGPSKWAQDYEAAGGNRQSPINIVRSQAKFDQKLADAPLVTKYSADNAKSLSNSGHSFMVDTSASKTDTSGFKPRPKPGVEPNTLQGGPLENSYEMAQWHAHWGANNCRGSEHTVDGNSFAAEIHLVHWNNIKYKSFGEAATKGDGLAVLGIFVKIGKEHAGLKQITDEMKKIHHSGQNVDLASGFDPSVLLPNNTAKFWTYLGSLTTPPCLESVIWIVLEEPIEISEGQVKAFRDLVSYAEGQQQPNDEFKGQIEDNFRPPLPLGDRLLRSSFQ
ncbi:unnamed protein product [Owenia fusiformis]|uniref:Carbonic anhydrase n=1 Tax=Owenia fusiformis TaxID=6347 RepID=A0A8J1Y9J1_OWEFU|nr:unnamed protein product [Owenia fusiformis]